MDTDFFAPEDPVQVRESVLTHEAQIRQLAKSLHSGGHWEARCALRDAADLLLHAGRTLAAEMPNPVISSA